jgi:hypothetical protein
MLEVKAVREVTTISVDQRSSAGTPLLIAVSESDRRFWSQITQIDADCRPHCIIRNLRFRIVPADRTIEHLNVHLSADLSTEARGA